MIFSAIKCILPRVDSLNNKASIAAGCFHGNAKNKSIMLCLESKDSCMKQVPYTIQWSFEIS